MNEVNSASFVPLSRQTVHRNETVLLEQRLFAV
ncbi:hypothetical protein J2W97_003195 [Paenibacillus jamilae]|nr:hypothetical protein [Paenibacillus jamilae]